DILLYVAMLPMLWKNRRDRRMLFAVLVPGIIGIALLWLTYHFGLIPQEASKHTAAHGRGQLIHVLYATWDDMLLLSLIGLPITLGILATNARLLLDRVSIIGMTVAALLFAYVRTRGHDFPNQDLITFYGLGPIKAVLQGVPDGTWGPPILYHCIQLISA